MVDTKVEEIFDKIRVFTSDGRKHNGVIERVSSAGARLSVDSLYQPTLECGDRVKIGFLFEDESLGDCEGVVTKIREEDDLSVCVRFHSNPGQNKVPVGLRMAIEQRHDPRISLCAKSPVEVDCSRGSDRSPFLGTMVNLSSSGAGVAIADLEDDLVTGSQMFLRFLLPGQAQICGVLAEIRHTYNDGDQTICGMQFVEPSCTLTERSRVAIRGFVAVQAIERMRRLVREATHKDQ